MDTETKTSVFRIEKMRSDAVLTLSNGDTVPGCFFVAAAIAGAAGAERVADVLNAEHGFFPFERHDLSGPRTVLYNRAQVVTIALADNETRREPGYELATRRLVSLRLSNGICVVGSVRVYRPEGRDRLSDWARGADHFRYVETDEGTLIINVEHVTEVSEVRG
jgi:hypothetical protein